MKTHDPYSHDPDNLPAGTVKEWPENGIVDYEDLVNPVLKIMMANYKWCVNKWETVKYDGYPRKFKLYRDVVYDGYNIGRPERSGIADPADNLSKASLRYHEERDRELMHVLVNILFCLGMEQGRRQCAERNHRHIEIMAEMRARGEKWPPEPASPEDMKKVGEQIKELLALTGKSVTKTKKRRKTKKKR